jgi:hypothetical protein
VTLSLTEPSDLMHMLSLSLQLEDEGTEYAPPASAQTRHSRPGPGSGFVVTGAPWNQLMPDTADREEFPAMAGPVSGENGSGSGSGGSAAVWGRSQ